MRYLKKLIATFSLVFLVACINQEYKESGPVKVAVVSKVHKAFDVLGNTYGENELDYDEYIEGARFSDGTYSVKGKVYKSEVNMDYKANGTASWYGGRFHGCKTASGIKFDKELYTAAHRHLPLPSVIRVINLNNDRSVIVVVNDRGPYKGGKNRIVDVSRQAAQHLNMLNKGVVPVKIEYLHEETQKLIARLPEEERNKALLAYQRSLTKQMAKNNIPSKKLRS